MDWSLYKKLFNTDKNKILWNYAQVWKLHFKFSLSCLNVHKLSLHSYHSSIYEKLNLDMLEEGPNGNTGAYPLCLPPIRLDKQDATKCTLNR